MEKTGRSYDQGLPVHRNSRELPRRYSMTSWKQIEQTVQQAVERGDIPSAAIGIGSMNRVYVQSAFGNTSITEQAGGYSYSVRYGEPDQGHGDVHGSVLYD